MKLAKRLAKILIGSLIVLIGAVNLWGALTMGTLVPAQNPELDLAANRVVMVFGATGSVGDGLLKAALNSSDVDTVHVVTRRTSPRIDAAAKDDKLVLHIQSDFTDYAGLKEILPQVNTVLWGLGTTSIGMDPDTYTRIHVDFPVAFVSAWLAARSDAPMAFHYVTGIGTGEDEDARWAQDKGRAERLVAEMAEGTGLRSFGHRSAYIRPTSEQSNTGTYILEWLLRPGDQVIRATALGQAMLEISARTTELANGTLIDNADAIAYANAYEERHPDE
ncbi:MAG: hypothetical protein ABJ056_08385 [Halioglobus sp.]